MQYLLKQYVRFKNLALVFIEYYRKCVHINLFVLYIVIFTNFVKKIIN